MCKDRKGVDTHSMHGLKFECFQKSTDYTVLN